jgi:hypothetical protein
LKISELGRGATTRTRKHAQPFTAQVAIVAQPFWFPHVIFMPPGRGGTSSQLARFQPEGSPNMRASTAYFAGAGTVVAAIVAGIGGGLLFANMISPKAPNQGMEQTRLERRMSPQPIQASDAAAQPVPYLAASQPPAPGVAAAAAPAQAQPQPAQPPTQTANSRSAAPVQAADTSAAPQKEAPATPASAATPVMRESTAVSDDAMARARDADLKRVVEKRRIERRQQWTERRRRQPRQEQRQDQELRAVEEKVREETEPRREFTADLVRIEVPQIRLFGPE